ncbi:MAG: hypothetical protein ISN29_00200 [Gammaproteobacteria bacterium AqS3]|nr:hypothetical protein [Gammaproteobacteria bacterium AqS3]
MNIQKICYCLCAVFCFAAALFHEIVGIPRLLNPLAASDLPNNVTAMLTFSWHNDVVHMLGVSALFACSAFIPGNKLLGWIAAAMVVGIGINTYWMALFYDPVMWQGPAPILWTVIPLIAAVGLLAKSK